MGVEHWQDRVIEQGATVRCDAGIGGTVSMVIEQNLEDKRQTICTINLNPEDARNLYRDLSAALGHGPHPEAQRLSQDREVSF